ncbi:MAG: class I SAM-dependent methyltransferase [Hyphomicrobiales bacterium]
MQKSDGQNPDIEGQQKVEAFYDEHPYPPPVDDLDRYKKAWDNSLRRRADFHLFWPDKQFRDNHKILVAGCGTSQAAKYAIRSPNAQITGIDVSKQSIEHTVKLKNKYDLKNIQVRQLSLEQVAKLDNEFDLIVCTGVLHHLIDPDSGLSALSKCLAPQGAMHLMVYAPFGRTGIYILQDYCRRLKIGTSSAEIQDLIASLRALPPDHPLVPLLKKSPDFRDESALADALLHPQDRSYTVDEFFNFIERAGLQFSRWIRQAPYSPHCGGITQVPHASSLAQLSEKEQYAAMELFRGNMLLHSAVVYGRDNEQRRTITFEGDDWLDYVPIRAFGTVNVEERLPPSAAAVLINQAHSQTDIYLPITQLQKKMVEEINGTRTVRQIIEKTNGQSEAITLFQRLWWYDQVVFNATPPESK